MRPEISAKFTYTGQNFAVLSSKANESTTPSTMQAMKGSICQHCRRFVFPSQTHSCETNSVPFKGVCSKCNKFSDNLQNHICEDPTANQSGNCKLCNRYSPHLPVHKCAVQTLSTSQRPNDTTLAQPKVTTYTNAFLLTLL